MIPPLRLVQFIVFLLFLQPLFSQETNVSCEATNRTFLAGEEYTYIVSYNWFVVFSDVGEVTFTITKGERFDQKAFHFVAEGKTYKWWDNFYKVRDRYEVWVKEENMRPLYFQRNTSEGSWMQQESYMYAGDSLIYRKSKVKEDPMRYDTIQANACTWDVLSAILYTRNFDYTRYKTGEKIPISVAMDEKVYDLYFRYLGVEDIKVKDLGTFECLKFTVLLVEGTTFNEGEDLLLWVTNDKNQIPVFIQSPIIIGSVKVRLTALKGNKYPLTSKH